MVGILGLHSEEKRSKNRLSIVKLQEKSASGSPLPQDRFAAELRGFGPLGILAVLIIAAGQIVPPLSAVLVLVWTGLSQTPWREIGYVRPKSWLGSLVAGIAFGIPFKFLMKAIVMPLLGANPTNQAYHYLLGNRAALPAAVFTMIVVAGFGEETVFRGYMFERLGKLLGRSLTARIVIVPVTAALFGSIHYFSQGLAGAQQATIGLVFGRSCRHRADLDADVCACRFRSDCGRDHLLESRIRVAHLIFKWDE
jgi:membrane protease YdiL (CAAX protease family)